LEKKGGQADEQQEKQILDKAIYDDLVMTIWTIGHSNRSLEEFLALLSAFEINVLADVRRFPGSKKHPHFNQESLAQSLAATGISYEFFPELGGRRKPRPDSPNTAWRNESFRAYADYMETAEYRAGVARLLSLSNSPAALSGDLRPPRAESDAVQRRVAIMCSEAVWWRCHRSLIADYLKSRGVAVEHVLSAKKSEPHPYTTAARLVDGRLSYAEHDPQARLF
jgi:uncharacterized protein (DUF488 family)